MAFSWQESVKPAGTQDIQCDIEYLDKSYIHVYLDGVETTAFTWTSSTNIRLNSPLSAETAVLLIRKTEREYLYIEFASGAPFIEVNVDTQNTQFLHLAQELVEGRSIEGFYGDINMHRYRITNLGDPVDARDAANKQYVDAGDARLDQRIDAERAAWVAAVANEASIRKAADDALDVRTTNLEQTYFNANTNSFPWWTILTTDTDTVTPGMPFTKAKVRVNGVTQTAGYSYTVNAGVVKFAEVLPAGTLVDMTIGIDTEADTSAVSTVMGLLASPSGASYIGTSVGMTVEQYIGSKLDADQLQDSSIIHFMTGADKNTLLNTPGAEVAVDYALQAAIDAGLKSVVFPWSVAGIYTLNGSVTIPSGFIITGKCSKPYTLSSTNPGSTFIGKGTVIRKAAGANYIFGPGSSFRIFGCILDGRDNLRPLIDQTNQVRGGLLFDCGLYRFLRIGSYAYTSIQIGMGIICANTVGCYNFIDSKVINVTINANASHGVHNTTGANNNLYENVRNEWNGGVGYLFDGSVGNIVSGELVDRNGAANFVVQNGGGCLVSGVFTQRPGRTSASESSWNTHFYMAGAGSYLNLSGVISRTGVDDGGGGTLTPERVIVCGGNSTDMTLIASGCDLSGSTLSPILYSTRPARISIRGCPGATETHSVGVYQYVSGRTSVGGVYQRQGLSSTVGATLSVSWVGEALADPSTNPASTPKCRTLHIEAISTSGVVSDFHLPFRIRRLSSTAVLDVFGAEAVSRPGGVWAVSGATGVNVTLTVSADGSTVTATLTNVDGAGRFVDLYLSPN